MSASVPSAPRSSVSTADERRAPGPVPLWEVPGWRERFGVVAGITGRGEDPAEPFDLGLWNSQPIGQAMARWRTFRAALPGFPAAVLAHQVHGSTVLWHNRLPDGWTLVEGADGHATAIPGQLMLITVADCVPIYLVAPRQRAVALLHAGWRGCASGMLAAGIEMLKRNVSVRSHEIVIHCGVAISGKCYEVGNEVLTAVDKPTSVSGHSHLDLRRLLVEQGAKLGIVDITSSDLCTATSRDRFFSHRGSGGTDGRMVAYLGMEAEAEG
jgi:YfiH family protein